MPATPPACPSCSTPLPPGALFCTVCGTATPTSLAGGATTPIEAGDADAAAETAYRERLERALGTGYQLKERIGRGGFGAVYRAGDVRLRRDVAVKVLRADLLQSRELEVRFLREAQAVARLRHPNIVPIYAVGEGEGLLYFIMPVVEGESLLARLQREGPLPVDEVRRILAEVAAALAVAHKAGIVHRDLKPENIMLEGEARHVLLMDFGIAKTVGAGTAGLTSQGMIVGTPYYMSPEQAMGSAALDGRSDVYSLGVVGFQMLTGRLPFHGESLQSILLMHISAPPPDVRALRPDTPPALARAVMRCLAKRPDERWATSAEFAAEVSASALPPAARRAPGSSWRRRGLAAAALVAVAGAGFAAWRIARGGAGAAAAPGRTAWEDLGVSVEDDTLAYAIERPSWLATLGDTALIFAYDSAGDLWAFSGDSVRPLAHTRGAGADPPFVVLGDTAWSATEYGLERLGAAGLAAGGDVPEGAAVRSVAAVGRELLVGFASGVIARRGARGWRREATGTEKPIRAIFGADSLREYAIVEGGDPAAGDSLLRYNGVSWTAQVLPTGTGTVRYAAGRTFAAGSTALVGRECAGDSACAPLVVEQDSFAAPWHMRALAIPASVRLTGVWGRGLGDYYVWGTDATSPSRVGCANGHGCLWHVTPRGAAAVAALGATRVLAMAALRGAPYALLEDGTLRTARGDEWPVAARLPGTAFGPVAATSRLGAVTLDDLGRARIGDDAVSPPPGARFVAVAARDSTAWLLTDAGQVVEATCARDCARRVLPAPDARPIRGIAVLPGGALGAVGARGLAARWTGASWRAESVPTRAADETLFGVSADRWGTVAVGSNLYVRDSTGRWTWFANEGDSAAGVAPLADGTVAFVAEWQDEDDASSWLLWRVRRAPDTAADPNDNFDELADSPVPVRILALSDGRLVAGFAQPNDPSRGGWLEIWRPPYAESSFVRVDLPRRADVYGLAEDGRYLYVTGSGWLSVRIPLDSLGRGR